MADEKDHSTMLFILSGIQASIRAVEEKIDDRWDRALSEIAAQREHLEHLEKEVEHTTKILSTGNGKPGIVTQVFKLQNDLEDVKDTCRATFDEVTDIKKAMHIPVPTSVRVERWKTGGLIVSFLITVATTLAAILT